LSSDTGFFVRSLINPSSRCGRIVFEYSDRYRLFVSEPVVREIVEVLNRPELRRKFNSLAALDFRRVLELMGEAEVVELSQTPAVSRDPKDDKFVATAVAAEADYLVTEDNDLLVLEDYGRTVILSTAEFLGVLESA